jgi:molybdenum cofactor synthesis domain-containing protein
MLRTRLGAEIVDRRCLPDERDQLVACFAEWSRPELAIDLVLSTGGTGLAPRDVTPEAARRVLEREHPGLMELARLRCLARSPMAFLSRGVAGTVGRTLILTLPGSVRGSTESLEALLDVLPHAISTLRGDIHVDGQPDATDFAGTMIHHER